MSTTETKRLHVLEGAKYFGTPVLAFHATAIVKNDFAVPWPFQWGYAKDLEGQRRRVVIIERPATKDCARSAVCYDNADGSAELALLATHPIASMFARQLGIDWQSVKHDFAPDGMAPEKR